MYIRYVYTKRKKLDKADGSLIDPYIPANPIMAQAWVDCLRWSVTEPEILAAFRAATGSDYSPGATPIERMIDQATGRDREFVEQYVAWFNENVWGEE
jgi:hypothetical protein